MRNQPPVCALNEYLDRWAFLHLCCDLADRDAAEAGLYFAYAAAGLETTPRVIWCKGPLEVANSLASASTTTAIGANVKVQVFDEPRRRIATFAEIFCKELLAAATERHKAIGAARGNYTNSRSVSAAVDRAVFGAVDCQLRRLGIRLRHALLRLRGLPRLLPIGTFDEVAIGAADLGSLGVYEYLHEVLEWQEATNPLRGLWKIAKSAGWLVPHAHVAWICERPSHLRTDAMGRLHCQDGPALRYPDGWCVYAWKGVEVPPWLIEHPDRITLALIADTFDPVLRNCMIEILTPERFVRSGGACRVAQDETGTLWRKLWRYRGRTAARGSAQPAPNSR